MKYPQARFSLYLLLLAYLFCAAAAAATPTQKNVRLFNEANVHLDVFWVHPQDKSIHKMTAENDSVKPGMNIDLKSFAGHEFEIHELGACNHGPEQICRRVIFQVNDNDDQSTYSLVVYTGAVNGLLEGAAFDFVVIIFSSLMMLPTCWLSLLA